MRNPFNYLRFIELEDGLVKIHRSRSVHHCCERNFLGMLVEGRVEFVKGRLVTYNDIVNIANYIQANYKPRGEKKNELA